MPGILVGDTQLAHSDPEQRPDILRTVMNSTCPDDTCVRETDIGTSTHFLNIPPTLGWACNVCQTTFKIVTVPHCWSIREVFDFKP
jgi:hypothetical protein